MSPRNWFWVSNLTIKSKPKTEPGRQAQQTGDLRDKITDSVTYWNAYVDSSWRMPRKRISSPSPVVRIRLTISKVKYGRFASCQATRSGAIETSLPEKSSRT